MERKGEQGSEEDDYFNKFPPTMPSVVFENRSIRMFSLLSDDGRRTDDERNVMAKAHPDV
jgi:hypothetical protein